MKMAKGLEIVISTAVGVGIFFYAAGFLYGYSDFALTSANMIDDLADSFAPLYGSENVQDMRSAAAEVRTAGISLRDSGMWCLVLAIVIGTSGAIWMAWSIHKGREEIVSAPAPSQTPPSEIPPLK